MGGVLEYICCNCNELKQEQEGIGRRGIGGSDYCLLTGEIGRTDGVTDRQTGESLGREAQELLPLPALDQLNN